MKQLTSISARLETSKKILILLIVGILIYVSIMLIFSIPTIKKYICKECNKAKIYRLRLYYEKIKPQGLEA